MLSFFPSTSREEAAMNIGEYVLSFYEALSDENGYDFNAMDFCDELKFIIECNGALKPRITDTYPIKNQRKKQ